MSVEARIRRIAGESLRLGVAPAFTPSWQADIGFGLSYSGDIWEAIAALRDGRDPVYMRVGRKAGEPEPEVESDDGDEDDGDEDGEDRDDPERDEDDELADDEELADECDDRD
jgi:hypothetical protein